MSWSLWISRWCKHSLKAKSNRLRTNLFPWWMICLNRFEMLSRQRPSSCFKVLCLFCCGTGPRNDNLFKYMTWNGINEHPSWNDRFFLKVKKIKHIKTHAHPSGATGIPHILSRGLGMPAVGMWLLHSHMQTHTQPKTKKKNSNTP